MAELNTLYESSLGKYPQLSLRHFCQIAEVKYHRLRDYRQALSVHEQKAQDKTEQIEQIRQTAELHPTYGYRLLYQELNQTLGREFIRKTLKVLGLNPAQVKKARRNVPGVVPINEWPAGRRVQLDATQISLTNGTKLWVYIALDVCSRSCLAIRLVRQLCQHIASEVICQAVNQLKLLGVTDPIVIQTDGGSDFTSHTFQGMCSKLGTWIRSKVSQKGGMGILERLNRTFKYQFIFRHELTDFITVDALCSDFKLWYNHQRKHSAIGYSTPWATLVTQTKANL
jgi:transposase InsO family protein